MSLSSLRAFLFRSLSTVWALASKADCRSLYMSYCIIRVSRRRYTMSPATAWMPSVLSTGLWLFFGVVSERIRAATAATTAMMLRIKGVCFIVWFE